LEAGERVLAMQEEYGSSNPCSIPGWSGAWSSSTPRAPTTREPSATSSCCSVTRRHWPVRLAAIDRAVQLGLGWLAAGRCEQAREAHWRMGANSQGVPSVAIL